ncbi:hypothetical protein ASG49_07995 [Marmoricola sp. Leaf446]|uniref:hypothetical protein n=1 Tax=Marmoricola sp. Leaf446 TaxID=1736379 RepID=UPI0006FF96F9|nr:hypothetical protein [Marmoricola sp. Leaf446]KQT94751.1 hypothetical protein ASG49_07995 [Marmoricola sp. Leaf446]
MASERFEHVAHEVVHVPDATRPPAPGDEAPPPPNLLTQSSVTMTVFAQDPMVVDARGCPVLARVSVPADRLQRGPRSHRLHVVDLGVGTNAAVEPVVLHDRSAWSYVDRWDDEHRRGDARALADDRNFRAQNVFAVASHTLSLFEQHLGRPIPWNSHFPQLYLVPQARVEANAFYSREHNAVLFGWLPGFGDKPPLYTALSYDVIAHEVSHAILDGLRPRYTEPGLPDQLAFHEALADLVALLSVFGTTGVAQHLLDPEGVGEVRFPSDAAARRLEDHAEQRERLLAGRAELLRSSPLARLAEQIGGRRNAQHPGGALVPGRYPALRRSIDLVPTTTWADDPTYAEPHRRAEILVAVFMQTLVAMWAERLTPLRHERRGGLDAGRVAEEGVKAAKHLLAMLLRALDYLPPVELEFADVIDSVLTADRRLAPDDDHDYRGLLQRSFEAFGITAPEHRILDEDGVADGTLTAPGAAPATVGAFAPDPDAARLSELRYEHLNIVALRTSPEEVYQFIWNNAGVLDIDVRLTTRVERVLSSTRVGPDGLVVNEIVADYVQTLRTTADHLPPGIEAPAGTSPDTVVELWGGGVLVFDQFGRFRLHQRKPIVDADRQTRRLRHLVARGLVDRDGGVGTSDGKGDKRRFSLLHQDPDGGE